jgi:hypothetical protein
MDPCAGRPCSPAGNIVGGRNSGPHLSMGVETLKCLLLHARDNLRGANRCLILGLSDPQLGSLGVDHISSLACPLLFGHGFI